MSMSTALSTALSRRVLPALALLATAASAQTVLQPGHPDLATSALTLESHVEAVRVAGDAAEAIGTVRHAVSRDGDTVTLATTSDIPTMRQSGTVTATFAWPSLRPISRDRSTETSTNTVRYDGLRVTGAYGRGEWDPLDYDITLRVMPFQPEVLPLLARALPLRAGYTATVPTFTADQRLSETTLSVIGQEDFVRADGSTVSVWAVEGTSQGFRGATTRRYLVDGDTRDLVAMSVEPQAGTTVVTEPTTEEALAMMEAQRAAGESIRPGSDQMAVEALTSYTQSYDIKVVQPMQADAGTQTRTVTVDEGAGTVTISTQTEITMAGQSTTEEIVLAYPSLRPISNTTVSNGSEARLVYSETGVQRGGDSPYELTFDEPVFDPSSINELVRLVPFEQDYQGRFESFTREGTMAIVLKVTGRDTIDGRAVWLVSAQPPEGPSTEFALDAETREMVRIKIQPQPGVEVHFVPAEG